MYLQYCDEVYLHLHQGDPLGSQVDAWGPSQHTPAPAAQQTQGSQMQPPEQKKNSRASKQEEDGNHTKEKEEEPYSESLLRRYQEASTGKVGPAHTLAALQAV